MEWSASSSRSDTIDCVGVWLTLLPCEFVCAQQDTLHSTSSTEEKCDSNPAQHSMPGMVSSAPNIKR
jgi:hypothetical protein